jgi:hypothetical protein
VSPRLDLSYPDLLVVNDQITVLRTEKQKNGGEETRQRYTDLLTLPVCILSSPKCGFPDNLRTKTLCYWLREADSTHRCNDWYQVDAPRHYFITKAKPNSVTKTLVSCDLILARLRDSCDIELCTTESVRRESLLAKAELGRHRREDVK